MRTQSTTAPAVTQPATVAEVCQAYLPTAARTLDSYRSRKYDLDDFCKHFGGMAVSAAKPYVLQLWLDAHPTWVSDWTRQRAVCGVHACFNWAARLGLIDKNPFRGFRVGGGERRHPMEDAEYHAILRHSPPEFRRFVIALRYTGARPGELAKATLDDVDESRACIELKKHKTSKKTSKPRRIILHPVLVAYLRWRRQQNWPTRLLFPNSRFRKWSNPAICHRLNCVRKLGLLRPGTSLYGLRHACATRAVLAGVSFPVIAELMGHARIATTMIYTHLAGRTDHLQNAMQQVFTRS
jgi:integrase